MKRTRFIRSAAALTVLALTAAACGSDRDSTSDSSPVTTTSAVTTTSGGAPTTAATTESTDAPDSTSATDSVETTAATDASDTSASESATTTPATDTTVPEGPMFGDSPWPCGPGDGNNADDGTTPGVTTSSIKIAGGDDAGYPGSPGLNHELTDGMKAAVAECNELGGINGRQIQFDYYDAALFNVGVAIQGACDSGAFFLVGEGWAFDVNQEETRLACGMPAVPGYAVSAAFAHGKDVFAPTPGPSDEVTAGMYKQFADLFPDGVKKAAALVGAFAATQETRDKAVIASQNFGWNWVSTTIEYNPAGEADWTPFVKQLQAAGAGAVYWSGTCLPGLQLFMQSAQANGLDIPVLTEANHYSAECAAANTDHAMDNLYVRMSSVPFEEADADKTHAMQDYLDLMTARGGDISQLGSTAVSAFLLWATAAQECGATLTRECAIANLKTVHDWTGHGLYTPTDPGANHPTQCTALLKLDGTAYVRVVPTEPATFDCDPSFIVPITSTPALDVAKLDDNRISQQFATG
jgi:ABC-type branched-subunit amino acid transport system substrate-binding protein